MTFLNGQAYGTILLICDDTLASDETMLMLGVLGFDVLRTTDGASGLVLLNTGVWQLRAVMIDLRAQEGDVGRVARLVRTFFPHHALLLVGVSPPEELSLLRRFGPEAQFLSRPYSRAELAGALAALLSTAE